MSVFRGIKIELIKKMIVLLSRFFYDQFYKKLFRNYIYYIHKNM